ncbi:MAG: hypothetical protein DRR19_25035 [Candidatus Parabeggiatoa sp. nov. 1]|nr:MAG: hypothetical protein DRR19_25035 [Gammaproteobacteria bacterium]
MSKIAKTLFGLILLAIIGSGILMLAATRVGEHQSSTYGNAYSRFQKSWGGEIGIIPPRFWLERTSPTDISLIPKSIQINSTVSYGEQTKGWLSFNAFEVNSEDTYVIRNETAYSGKLLIKLTKPDDANILYDYKIVLPDRENTVLRPVMDKNLLLLEDFQPKEQLKIIITYATHGMNIFKYNLSDYQESVIEHFQAQLNINNTHDFEIYRFGLPHQIEKTQSGALIRVEINNFATTQDLGITFASKQMYLDQIQSLMAYSPVSLVLYLLVIFVFSQIYAIRFHGFHYLFIAMITIFYFLFVAYLVRFFGIDKTFGLSFALTMGLFFAYCPNIFGWRFALKIAAIYLILLTTVYSVIFLMPIFRGLLFIALIFVIFMSIMIPISRSDISKWYILSDDNSQRQE